MSNATSLLLNPKELIVTFCTFDLLFRAINRAEIFNYNSTINYVKKVDIIFNINNIA
jgi:hypothetical protein